MREEKDSIRGVCRNRDRGEGKGQCIIVICLCVEVQRWDSDRGVGEE